MKTTEQIAQETGNSKRTVQKWCAHLGLQKIGRDYLLNASQESKVRALMQDKPGRPPK